ncbi:MAG TPA: protein-methionine-sulfoxide reductase heme-binding subunit MsrQ [Candidatus Binatia bacterium]|nr:protein-methionine-sulfoxide reductase heme-binding subunit MsrQ [Candidatus Binatia bacterium]
MASKAKNSKKAGWAPWQERNGSFSWFRAATLLAVCLPGIVTLVQYYAGYFPVRPITEIIHATGLWTIRLLMIALVVTPFRQAFRWPRLVVVRRMIGVAAFSYVALHLTFYAADNMFNLYKVGSEIVLRIYLTIGFAAVLILGALALTSTDGMLRRMGGAAWIRLHRWVYVAGVLACIHYFMQSKLNVSEPLVVAGLFVWMMLYRLVMWTTTPERAGALGTLAGLGVLAALATGFGEAAYYHLVVHAPFWRVLQADTNFHAGIRPAWYVLGITMAVVVAAALRQWQRARQAALAAA